MPNKLTGIYTKCRIEFILYFGFDIHLRMKNYKSVLPLSKMFHTLKILKILKKLYSETFQAMFCHYVEYVEKTEYLLKS